MGHQNSSSSNLARYLHYGSSWQHQRQILHGSRHAHTIVRQPLASLPYRRSARSQKTTSHVVSSSKPVILSGGESLSSFCFHPCRLIAVMCVGNFASLYGGTINPDDQARLSSRSRKPSVANALTRPSHANLSANVKRRAQGGLLLVRNRKRNTH